jgi:hypothetical protein
MRRFGEVFAVAIAIVLSIFVSPDVWAKDSPSTRPTAAATTTRSVSSAASRERKADAARSSAVSVAIRDLGREYAAHLADPKKPLRGVCNYFNDHPGSDVTPEAVLSALERTLASDPRADGYIKWQLLSGAPGKFEDSQLPRVLRIYKSAPEPLPAPGITQEEKTQLEIARQSARQDNVEKLNQQLNQLEVERREANEPILAYRGELFAKLPATYDAITAGLEDAFVRLKAGADTQSIVEPVIKTAHGWMPAAKAEQLTQLSQLAGTLSKQKGPELYEAAWWSERSYKVMWRKHTPDMNKSDQLGRLQRDLMEQARNPASSLKFKDESGSSRRSNNTGTGKDRS